MVRGAQDRRVRREGRRRREATFIRSRQNVMREGGGHAATTIKQSQNKCCGVVEEDRSVVGEFYGEKF